MSEEKNKSKSVANHILPTSANLLGICFLIFGVVRQGDTTRTVLDDCAALAVVIFLFASIFSYVSIRNEKRIVCERIADRLFMMGLCLLGTCSVLMALQFIK